MSSSHGGACTPYLTEREVMQDIIELIILVLVLKELVKLYKDNKNDGSN